MANEALTSPKNPRIQSAADLRERKARLKQGLFLIEGAREIERALASKYVIKEIFSCEDHHSDASKALLKKYPKIAITEVGDKAFAKLAVRDASDGLVAVAVSRTVSWDALPSKGKGLVFVLEGVEKPGNLGAFLRSADGAGVDLVVVLDDSADPYHPHVVRTSLGAVFSLPLMWTDHKTAAAQLKAAGYQVYAADPDAQAMYYDVEFAGATAVVLGSEAEGLSDFWQVKEVKAIKLPMHGIGDSLNVATTGAILAYEVRRQFSCYPNKVRT